VANQTPEKLFKFCSTNTAEKILRSSTLRWSSPVVFGDPMELNHASPVSFDRDSLLQAAIKLASSMIFANDSPRGDTPLINAIRRWREEERFGAPDEAEIVLQELLSKMVDQRMLTIQKQHQQWIEYNRNVRVCSFSTRPDNTVAWERFGNNHKGVCLRFHCGGDASVKHPWQIKYVNARPEISNLKEQIDAILYNLPANNSPDFSQLQLVKSPTKKLEQEWRCFRQTEKNTINDDSATWVDDITFPSSELSAICFGIDTSPADKETLRRLAKDNFGAARCYQANLANGKYDLEIQKA